MGSFNLRKPFTGLATALVAALALPATAVPAIAAGQPTLQPVSRVTPQPFSGSGTRTKGERKVLPAHAADAAGLAAGKQRAKLTTATACTGVTETASPASPSPAGTVVTFSAVASGCPDPTYEFWVQPPGGAWTVLQAYSTSSSASWNTAGALGGTWLLDVWVRESGSIASFEADIQPNPTYVVGPPCTSVTESASPASPSAPGTTITFSAAATGCPNPTYEFWVQPPGGAWAVLQAYSTSATATWNTAGLGTGTYLLDVYARNAGSGSTFEAHISPNASYTLSSGSACTSVTESVSPASPSAAGTTVAFTASATGCPNPTYEFWVQPPGGTWQVIQAYSSTTAASWNTSGVADGTWLLDVWARQSGSTASFEADIQPNPTYVIGPPCTSVSETASPASPQQVGTTVTFTATATGCPSPTYEFWIQPPGGAWQIAQAYSASSTFSWNTAGLAGGTWLLDVYARNAGSGGSKDANISPNPSYTLNSVPPCTSVKETASPASPAPLGATVTFTATSTGCATPSYEFWIQAPGGSWQIVQAYSTSSTYTWNTSGLPGGTYILDVWVRAQGSTNSFDADIQPNPTYVLGPPCTSVTESASPASPSLPGTSVTFAAAATGCPNPTYEFWIQAPGAGWQIVQAYSSSATYTWNTSGLAAGTYLLDVWARNAGSAANYEAHISPNPSYVISQPPTCASVTESVSPASPSAAGTIVTFTATASGCSTPTYQFWVQPPGGSWQIMQAYSTASTYSWNTAGLVGGTWLLDVWVRAQGSANSFDADVQPNPKYVLGPPCTAVTETASPASPAAPGTTVTFTASASGCPNPTYEFWVQAPGGAWQVAQAYGSSATFNWKTNGLATGTYLLDVYVRNAGSGSTYEAHISPNPSYSLSFGPPCTSVTESASPASPSEPGTTVNFSAVATGCSNPTYEFWVQPPGGAWQIAQAYSSSSTFAWNTNGLVSGTWLLDVWVRQSGETVDKDADIQPNPTYVLGPPCSSVTENANPASPAPPGTMVTFSASASGCPQPTYEFWIQPPGGSWQIVQAYSAASSYTWNTSGLVAGTYLLDVYARNAGSGSTFEAHISPNPSYRIAPGWNGLDSPGISAVDEGFCCVPPDTTGAIGPTRYVEFVNTEVEVYDRSLNSVSSLDLATFSGAGSLNVSDPQIQWDPRSNRWYYSLVAFTSDFSSTYLLFGWSTTSDPSNLSSGWCRFGFNNGSLLPDYPKLGHDDNWIVYGANLYDMSKSTQPFVTAQVWATAKPPAGSTSCSASSVFAFASSQKPLKNADGSLAFTPVPVNTQDASVNGFVVAAHTPTLAPTGPQTKVMAWHLNRQSPGTPALVSDGDLTVASFDVPASVPQPGAPIDSLDARLTQAVGHVDPAVNAQAVWTQHTINGPGGRSVVRWYELLPSSKTVRQQGNVASSTDFVFNGAISPSITGNDAVVIYNRANASETPVVAGLGRKSTTPFGQLDPGEQVMAASSGADDDLSCSAPYGPPCRWGDYSGATPDPLNAGVVWASNQTNDSSVFGFPNWSTWNFALQT